MKLRNEARHLRKKALSSMRTAMVAFNSLEEDGRSTRVLLHLQHAFEMLLKAALVQARRSVFDKETEKSIGFKKCINVGGMPPVSLSAEEAGTLRAIDAMRDVEQHWFGIVDEGLLYLYARAGVTLFDDLLHRVFGDRLADHMPLRVLPVGTEPPQDFQTLVEREYENIAELLKPRRRARANAEARVRALLAMEAQVDPEAEVSDADVRRVVRGIQAGKARAAVFPQLSSVGTTVQEGTGLALEVRFVKNEGLPVRLVAHDEEIDAAAIRLVPLHNRFHWGAFPLADKLGLSRPKATALRAHLGIDADPECSYTFEIGPKTVRYSDNALKRMRSAIDAGIDMKAIWNAHGTGRHKGSRPACTVDGCRAQEVAS